MFLGFLCDGGGVRTCGDLLDQLSGVVAALHQQVGPGGEVPGGVHPEHVGLHPLLGACAQAERQLRLQQGGGLPRAGVDQSEEAGRRRQEGGDRNRKSQYMNVNLKNN